MKISMKTFLFVFLLISSLYILSCSNNPSTQDPNGGYKERSDSAATTSDSVSVPKDNGAVALDTIKNGQASMSGAKSDSSK